MEETKSHIVCPCIPCISIVPVLNLMSISNLKSPWIFRCLVIVAGVDGHMLNGW